MTIPREILMFNHLLKFSKEMFKDLQYLKVFCNPAAKDFFGKIAILKESCHINNTKKIKINYHYFRIINLSTSFQLLKIFNQL